MEKKERKLGKIIITRTSSLPAGMWVEEKKEGKAQRVYINTDRMRKSDLTF